jgi:type II secretion system protein C
MEKLLTKYFWILNLLTLAVVAYLLSDGTGELIASKISKTLPQTKGESKATSKQLRGMVSPSAWNLPSGREILERNIFDSTYDPLSDPFSMPSPDEIPETVSGDMPIVPCTGGSVGLLATVASKHDISWSFASVSFGKEQKLCRVGDELDNRTVSGITWRYLFLRGSSDECFIDLYGDQVTITPKPKEKRPKNKGDIASGIRSISDTEKVVDRSVINSLMSNPTQFIKSVRVRPHKVNGEVVGFKLRRFRSNSPLALLGAKKGDIIHSVNGIDLTSMDQALGAYQSMGQAGNLTFSITRNGAPMEINVKIN